ncbi:MAG: cupin domain-containing protein [Acidimicrobiales bacterium]
MADSAVTAKKSFDEPDEVLDLAKGRVQMVTIGGVTFDRSVFEPGWRWSEHVKPTVKTDSCEFPHQIIVTEGTLHVHMDDGIEFDVGPGEAAVIAPGHDAWVTSEIPCVMWGIDGDDRDWGKPTA